MLNMINVLDSISTSQEYTCGNSGLVFSGMIPNTVSLVIKIIQIAVPILLVVFGLMDLAKAVMAQKEDEIKKGQQTLIKRVITAVIVFFVILIVQLVVRFLSGDDSDVINCFNCFVNAKVGTTGCVVQQTSGGGLYN